MEAASLPSSKVCPGRGNVPAASVPPSNVPGFQQLGRTTSKLTLIDLKRLVSNQQKLISLIERSHHGTQSDGSSAAQDGDYLDLPEGRVVPS
jgi:hypothetical protein